MLSDRVKFWRLKNLIHISEKFERICKEKNLDPTKLRPLTPIHRRDERRGVVKG